MQVDQKPILVISAFSCACKAGSEEAVGWQAVEMAEGAFDIHVFCDYRSKSRFTTEELQKLVDRDIHFYFCRGNKILQRLGNLNIFFRNLYYNNWQRKIGGLVKYHLVNHKIAICHHVSWARYSSPTSLGELGVPMLIGPVGGADTVSANCFKYLSLKGLVKAWLKKAIICVNRYNPNLRQIFKKADLILACTQATFYEIKQIAPKTRSATVSLLSLGEKLERISRTEHQTIITTGRLVEWKGFAVVIEAFNLCSSSWKELVIVGDGPDRSRLERLAQKTKIKGKTVCFKGQLTKDQVVMELKKASVFCFGSFHDSGGFSVIEAMSLGLPVVCLDVGGPGLLVTEESGFKISVEKDRHIAEKMASALTCFIEDKKLWSRKSKAAQERAEELIINEQRVKRLEDYHSIIRK